MSTPKVTMGLLLHVSTSAKKSDGMARGLALVILVIAFFEIA